ncbi:hypothetical protein JANAI62_17650 [Jannaschia pagri]|uniref:DoxX-like family protein n=1 Tax=Jannaschia pagri TaxID=2829797 RepID=A0ABQ4NM09_9RHOB|nr:MULTISPECIES: hypothetical protein [unclassified Jannaschia]GIT91309.1 hypothetical protein JANAI61_17670 [Jannaschia sp. AI_61]GIT95142.1 hypothetical protein JANAI62_17650 [Jannaschia sp. AI_62]
MTGALTILGAMVALRLAVLSLFQAFRHGATIPAWMPPRDQWASLTPFLIGEVPLFLALALWLRTGSPWPAAALAILALIGLAQGVVTARRDGLSILHLDVPLAAGLLLGLALLFWRPAQ